MNPLDGLKFIMSHLPKPEDEPTYPRTVSTLITENGQRDTFSLEHMLEYFEAADWVDARLGAYPKYDLLAQKGKLPWGYVPKYWILMIDQEKGDIKTTLHNIKMNIGGGYPTVLWTGHGHHVYQPMLIQNKEILNNRDTAVQYLRFIERSVSASFSDKGHYPSFNSCMLRIPGTYNQKCTTEGVDPEVEILQQWDGFRVSPANKLLQNFMTMQNRLRIKQLQKEREEHELIKKYGNLAAANEALRDPLTEFLIFNCSGIPDGRQNVLYFIIARYLIKIRGVDRETAEGICADWCRRCHKVAPILSTTYSLKYHIKHCVTDAIHKHHNDPYPAKYINTFSPESYVRLMQEYESFKKQQQQKDETVVIPSPPPSTLLGGN